MRGLLDKSRKRAGGKTNKNFCVGNVFPVQTKLYSLGLFENVFFMLGDLIGHLCEVSKVGHLVKLPQLTHTHREYLSSIWVKFWELSKICFYNIM